MSVITRREFVISSLLLPALARLQSPAGAHLVRTVPFLAASASRAPLNQLLGSGLDARLFTDLSPLSADALVTPADRFFVRTAAPPSLPPPAAWTVSLGGLVREPVDLTLDALQRLSRPAGRWLIECAGNADRANYGLMSVAEWEGAPLPAILERAQPSASTHRVLVSGVDYESAAPASRTSLPGASWIFSRDDLRSAILALRMNGAPLPAHHGAPVRLVVPNWYGCACIKWVNRIELVADDAAATGQMREYAARTHQPGGGPPARARDYTPAVVDAAAMPVRVEQWIRDGEAFYRVVGIVWGGTKPTNALAIRFKSTEPWVPVESCPMPENTLAWSVWTHTWRPKERGKYEIVLKVTDPTIRARRLDLFYYIREIQIEEV